MRSIISSQREKARHCPGPFVHSWTPAVDTESHSELVLLACVLEPACSELKERVEYMSFLLCLIQIPHLDSQILQIGSHSLSIFPNAQILCAKELVPEAFPKSATDAVSESVLAHQLVGSGVKVS